jgi:hypothetical protein
MIGEFDFLVNRIYVFCKSEIYKVRPHIVKAYFILKSQEQYCHAPHGPDPILFAHI